MIPEINYITTVNMNNYQDKDKNHRYHTISGAFPENVIGRLEAVIGKDYHRFLSQGGDISHIITNEAHKKLRIVFEELQSNPRKKEFIQELLEGSRACINGIIQTINSVFNKLHVVDSLENQILTLFEEYKIIGLEEFIEETHPESTQPHVLNDRTKASLQYPHMKNAYINLLGKELGLRSSEIEVAKTDKFASGTYLLSKNIALKRIKEKIKLPDFVEAIMNDVNNEVCNVPQIIKREKITNWAYNIEYGGNFFDGKRYKTIPNFSENYIWDQTTKELFPTRPKKDKNLAWLTKASTLKMLELEDLIK